MQILMMHQLLKMAISHSEVTLDWLLEDYVYSPPVCPYIPLVALQKEWTIFDIDDSDFKTAKVKMDSKADKEKKAKMKKQIKALKEMKK